MVMDARTSSEPMFPAIIIERSVVSRSKRSKSMLSSLCSLYYSLGYNKGAWVREKAKFFSS